MCLTRLPAFLLCLCFSLLIPGFIIFSDLRSVYESSRSQPLLPRQITREGLDCVQPVSLSSLPPVQGIGVLLGCGDQGGCSQVCSINQSINASKNPLLWGLKTF